MKKIIAVTIALCLVFASVVPCFAASDVVVTAFFNAASNTGINAGQLMQSLLNTIVAINSKLPAVTSTGTVFENIDTRLGHIESWLVPSNSAGTNPSLYQLILELGIAAQSYLPYIPTISNYVGSWMTSNNNYLSGLYNALTNPSPAQSGYDIWYWRRYLHQQMMADNTSGKYTIKYINSSGQLGSSDIYAGLGTPVGNIALILRALNNSLMDLNTFRISADLKHYNDTLTTWDSQGDALTQVTFTPESAIQGLYRYLAFTQRDVARLTYVLASDQEIEAREQQQAVTTAVTDEFLNPGSYGSLDPSDVRDIASMPELSRNKIYAQGYSPSDLMDDAFDQDNFTGSDSWFTVTTANNLGYYPNTSSTMRTKPTDGYETPLLNAYYEEILSRGSDKK